MKNFFVALFGAVVLLSGCAVEGCTDLDAVNYESDATQNDGSCNYEGRVVFWYGQAVSEAKSPVATSYTYYVDGEVVGSQAVSTFWTGAPDCGQNASITVTKDMGGSKIYPATYEVVDDAGYTIWSGIVNFEANTCTAYELTL